MAFGSGGAGGALVNASDVSVNNPVTNNFLAYDDTSKKWGNLPVGGIAAMATGGGLETVNALGNRTGATAVSLAAGNVATMTLTGAVTLSFTGATAGKACSIGLYIKQDGTGNRLITWPTSVKWAGGVKPVLSTIANALDIVVVESLDGGANWYGSLVGTSFS